METNTTKRPSLIKRLIDWAGNPMEWNHITGILFYMSGQLVFFYIWLINLYITTDSLTVFAYILNSSGAIVSFWLHSAIIVILTIIFVLAIWMLRVNINFPWLGYPIAFLISAQQATILCSVGHSTNPITLLMLFLNIFIGLFFFDKYFTISVIIAWVLVLGFHLIGEAADIIPYAWLLTESPHNNGTIEPFFVAWGLGSGLTLTFIMVVFIGYSINRWRLRETQVTELSDLLKRMFGRYLSTEVMYSLIEDPSLLELGGERREVTIMMTDLRGFTALSERLKPEQVVQMLNGYFEVMVDTVLKYKGTINEIIGDALLVIFGAPQEMQDQAERAIACSIEMQNAMAKVNHENRSKELPDLEMGIGINKAEVIVGNIGSSKRSKYAVVGSGVNMTSRIESYTTGGQILISESVYMNIGQKLRIDSEQKVYPKGSDHALKIFEIGGIADKYNLMLESEDSNLVELSQQIQFQYSILGGKHVRKEKLEGQIIRLSKKSAEMKLAISPDLLSNIRIRLIDVEDELMSKDFYGKVIEELDSGNIMVRFTSIPPELSAYFQAFRLHALQ